MLLSLSLLSALAACDSRATAANGAAIRPDQLSRELESCGTTSHCAEGLRCWERVCQRAERSALGDYQAARGARFLATNDIDSAIASYAEGLAAYESAKLTVPPDVDCAYGLALARARGKKDKAELAARVLHRCLLAVPVVGPLRAQALAGLAELGQVGLDPNQIARPQLADLYLTRAPSKPPIDKLQVTVTADPAPRGRTYALIPERLGEADARSALVACWEKNFAATQAKELSVKLPLEVKYRPSDYDDEPGTYALNWGPAGSSDADGCVRAAVESLVAPLKIRDAMTTTLTVVIK
ncbi:MAG: hypothetical protein K8M05_40500 [Deltaproteobacteria bacterium]|nr:hypothetical protein [Kofleriaceae bacterium]